MTMVENRRSCVLQWAGHAGYVTERFSGLLARQALVDVTLVCEEQKLRVHKLVLASNSVYFEEILQQDLGEEPIIFLKDLNFEILKAMVEFMYCGETTITHQLIPSLLAATRTFKVKKLASVINTMMESDIETFETSTNAENTICVSNIMDSPCNSTDCKHLGCSDLEKDECFLHCNKSSNNDNLNGNQYLESDGTIGTPEHELEHTLYEESQDLETNGDDQIDAPFLISASVTSTEDKTSNISSNCKIKDVSKKCSDSNVINNDIFCTNDGLKPILYEQCCDFSDVDECEESSMSLSRSCLQQIEKDFAQYNFETTDVPSKVRKCVKVYSHKRRKSTDDVKNKLADMNNIIQNSQSTDCIDLLEEPSANDIPVTLLTSLDMESAEYIISLSTENIQSIVGATLNEQHALSKCNEMKHIIDYNPQKENINKKELNSENSENSNCIKPILRRSLRLNQQETEETGSNESVKESNGREKQFRKSYAPSNTDFCMKGKRKVKDVDRKVPDHVNGNAAQTRKNFNNSRNHKNSTKLIVKKNNKSTCTSSSKERDEQKIRTNGKLKCESSEKIETSATVFESAKLSTLEHINRALWGDMSDISEDSENKMNLLECTPNTEIPFAVGLLPLRTALEKMQATPDYQPRKTRSSVAPIKQDANSLKRKNCGSLDNSVLPKRQNNYISDPKHNANTVCHIEIRTAPSQYIRNRKKFLSADITTLEPSAVVNRQ